MLLTELAGHLDCQLPAMQKVQTSYGKETLTTKQLMIVELIEYYYCTIAYS